MDRSDKERVVQELGGMFSGSGMVVVMHYRGLNVAQMSKLRGQAREVGASVRVAKNRLARIALRGTGREGLDPLFDGPTAIACADEPVGVARAVCNFAKAHEQLVILGGAMGETVLDAAAVTRLSRLPSLDELRGTLVGLLAAPATKLVRTMAEPGARTARVLAARGQS